MNIDIFDETQYCINKIKQQNKHRELQAELLPGSLSIVPPKLKFIFNSGDFRVQEKIIEITNYFSKPCPLRFLPLKTQYFKLKDTFQRTCLKPGALFKMNVLFTPDENRDYNDVFRVCYFNNQSVQIKIFAKVTTKFDFPNIVNFGNVPLGRTVYHKIPIHSHETKEFSFAILSSNGGDCCVDIYPRWGHVRPRQKPVIIMVIYRPLQYVSMNFQVRIFISDLCKAPHVINFYAYTRPGLLREKLENIKLEVKKGDAEHKKVNANLTSVAIAKPISVVGDKPVKLRAKEYPMKYTHFESILLKQCNYVLHSLHAVNCVLNSKVRRSFDEYELKGPLNMSLFETMQQRRRKLKDFLAKVQDRHRENEQAKFHYKPKVNYGSFEANEAQIDDIKTQRQQAWNDYKILIMRSEEDAFEQQTTVKFRRRVLRAPQKYPAIVSTSSRNEEPFFHYCKIRSFLQVARKILLRNRLLKVLTELQKLTPESIN